MELLKFTSEGKDLILEKVPLEDGIKHLALYKPARQLSEFINSPNPEAGPIVWQKNCHTWKAVCQFKPTLENYREFLGVTKIPLLFKIVMVALISEIEMMAALVAVAYGLSRFRISGLKYIFLLLIAPIMMPSR